MGHTAPRRGLRVTHVTFGLDGGGLETLIGEMARWFFNSDLRMSVISLSGTEGRIGAESRPLLEQYVVSRQVRGWSMAYPRRLAGLIRQTDADVVHLHSGVWFKGAVAARLAGVRRIVYTEHGREHWDPLTARWLDRTAARLTPVVAAVSSRLAEYLTLEVGIPRNQICVVPNGVRTDLFTPGTPASDLRDRLGLEPNAVLLGSVGRLECVKAYDRLIDVFARLRKRPGLPGPLYLLLCGDGSERRKLEQRVAAAGLGDWARLVGWCDKPVDLYRALDVFALTSLSEGASVSLLEAMACGRAVVVTDVGGNAATLGRDLARCLVPGDDLSKFEDVVYDLLVSPRCRGELGRIARKRVVTQFAFERMVHQYDRLYRGRYLNTKEGS